MHLELLIECSTNVPLILYFEHERTVLVQSLEVIDDLDLFSTIEFLVVFEELFDEPVVDLFLGSVVESWDVSA